MKKNDFSEDEDFLEEIKRIVNGQTETDSSYAEPEDYDRPEIPGERRPKRKRRIFRKVIITILALLLISAAALLLLSKQPIRETEALGDRKRGISTILIAGTDDEGYRTDTIILAALNSSENTVSLLSIPRDTYCSGYSVPKINSACGAAGGGEAGMEELMERISELIGFMPDGYVMVNLDAFVEVVDTMGGVDFEVPMDMYYVDPTQELYIDIPAGYRHLNGEDAIGLVRFRSGYAMADLERVNVQRAFIKAAMAQWTKPTKLVRLPFLVGAVSEGVTTDLSLGNMIWLARSVYSCDLDNMVTKTLPGTPEMINGGSYVVPDEAALAELIEESFSPY